ncbi:hypothetical protein B296_00022901 [Ensete ventricosum]|uniref:Uncharacterized protein n=1 Tax=Ensete ventricosum TaxID=4639 RepID=A0A427A6F3_ENSVE|nr:hypothetical protein B296_00022901 [Ensete ventricosum]
MRKSRRESHQRIRSGEGGRREGCEENEIRYLRPTASVPTPLPSPPSSSSRGCRETTSLGGGNSGSRAYLYAERVAEEAIRRVKKASSIKLGKRSTALRSRSNGQDYLMGRPYLEKSPTLVRSPAGSHRGFRIVRSQR